MFNSRSSWIDCFLVPMWCFLITACVFRWRLDVFVDVGTGASGRGVCGKKNIFCLLVCYSQLVTGHTNSILQLWARWAGISERISLTHTGLSVSKRSFIKWTIYNEVFGLFPGTILSKIPVHFVFQSHVVTGETLSVGSHVHWRVLRFLELTP